MAYDYASIQIEGLKTEHIRSLNIKAQKGEHTTLTLQASIEEEQMIHNIGEKSLIQVYLKGKEKKLIFDGMITQAEIEVSNGVYEIFVTAKNGTYLMDITKHSRSFQNPSLTYHQMIKKVMGAYEDADCMIEISDGPIGEMIVQYEETDWEFIKRIVSVFKEGVFPVAESKGIKFYAGVPEISSENFQILQWEAKKELEGYFRRNAEQPGSAKENDYAVFYVDSYDFIGIGSNIQLMGQTLYIRSYDITIENGLIMVHYEAQKKGGIRKRTEYPMQLVGAAVGGRIIEIKGDKVKVWLDIDKSQSVSEACFIPYSTVSASNDGTGWYCMPEKDDLVRVYFPTKYTKDAVALSSVSEYASPPSASGRASGGEAQGSTASGGGSTGGTGASGGGKDRMGDPNVLFLSNVHGKEVSLSPAGIHISCAGGSIDLTSAGDLSVFGKTKVDIKAEETIDIKASAALTMTALEKIELSCDKGAKITLDKNVDMKGTEVKLD